MCERNHIHVCVFFILRYCQKVSGPRERVHHMHVAKVRIDTKESLTHRNNQDSAKHNNMLNYWL